MIDKAIERVRHAIDAGLPHYQLTAELLKLRDEVVAEVEARVTLPTVAEKVEEGDEPHVPTLVERIEALKSNAKADELAKELGVEFPADVTKFSAKVEHLLEHAQAPAATEDESPEEVEPTEEQKQEIAELVAGGVTEEEATAQVLTAEPETPAA